jgi:glycosyltransferase involved in cell wall biosynthesis
MRVLVLTTSFPLREDDFSGRFIFEQVRVLSRKNINIEVLAPHHENYPSSETFDGVNVTRFKYAPSKFEKLCYGGGISENVKTKLTAKLELPFFLLIFLAHALLKARKFDLIHAHWLTISGLVGAVSKILYKKPLVVTIHGSDLRGLDNNFFVLTVNKLVLRLSDHIITVNKELKKRLETLGVDANKISVVYNGISGISHLLKIPTKKTSTGNLLFLSRLTKIKNLKFVLESLVLLEGRMPNLRLTVVGDGPQKEELEAFVKEKGLIKQVSFVGGKSLKEVINYYKDSDLFVLPQRAEGFGISLLEAMAAGVPTISGKVRGIEEMIEEGRTGFTVRLSKPDDLADLILSLVKNRALLNSVSFEARDKVNNLNWEKQSKEIMRIYKSFNEGTTKH